MPCGAHGIAAEDAGLGEQGRAAEFFALREKPRAAETAEAFGEVPAVDLDPQTAARLERGTDSFEAESVLGHAVSMAFHMERDLATESTPAHRWRSAPNCH
jgi:hypothetical protein